MKEKVLVTGANGFLGNHVVRVLQKEGYSVVAMVREKSSTTILKELNCEIFRGSITNPKDINKVIKNCDYVVHCASMTSQNEKNFEVYKTANVTTTKVLIKACKVHMVKRFILVSTANCFTNGTIDKPGNETTGFMGWLKKSHYAYSKHLAQEIVLKEVDENNFPAIVVAPTFLVGPYDSKPSSGALLQYALKNKVLFYPKGGKNFVDVNYVAVAIKNSLKTGTIGECYLLSGINLSYKEYFKKIASISNKKKWLVPIPNSILNIVNSFYFVFPSKGVLLLKTNVRMLLLKNYFSNTKAVKHLDMPETNIDASIYDTIEWFKYN
ncbi:MAG: NAD-dependent epimerase/dehydratase family protein [Cellulophaga sp.]